MRIPINLFFTLLKLNLEGNKYSYRLEINEDELGNIKAHLDPQNPLAKLNQNLYLQKINGIFKLF